MELALERGLLFREMRQEDLDQVMELERRCFVTPWSRGLMEEELSHSWAFLYVLVEPNDSVGQGGRIVGYVDFWVLYDEVHLMSLAVAPARQGQGLGGLLLDKVVEAARLAGVERVVLEVRAHNEPAKSLYRSRGFRTNRIRPRYYADTGEDALEMLLDVR